MAVYRELADGTIEEVPQAEVDAAEAESLAFREGLIREAKIEEIKANGLTRVQVVLPNVEDMDDVHMLKKLAGSFTPTAAATTANQIYNYAVDRIQDARTLDITTVQAYDPATDPNWPS